MLRVLPNPAPVYLTTLNGQTGLDQILNKVPIGTGYHSDTLRKNAIPFVTMIWLGWNVLAGIGRVFVVLSKLSRIQSIVKVTFESLDKDILVGVFVQCPGALNARALPRHCSFCLDRVPRNLVPLFSGSCARKQGELSVVENYL